MGFHLTLNLQLRCWCPLEQASSISCVCKLPHVQWAEGPVSPGWVQYCPYRPGRWPRESLPGAVPEPLESLCTPCWSQASALPGGAAAQWHWQLRGLVAFRRVSHGKSLKTFFKKNPLAFLSSRFSNARMSTYLESPINCRWQMM